MEAQNKEVKEVQQISIGRIVEFFPGVVDSNTQLQKLPNGMQSAPAICVQTFGNNIANMNVFTAEHTPINPVRVAWSVKHKLDTSRQEDEAYWDWFARV